MKAIITPVLLTFLLFGCVQQTYERKVTFELDTKGMDVRQVSIRGNFSPLNWNENYDMSDPDSDGIYTASIRFDTPFDYMEFKFVINGDQFELNGKPNRKVFFNKDGATVYKAVFDEIPPDL